MYFVEPCSLGIVAVFKNKWSKWPPTWPPIAKQTWRRKNSEQADAVCKKSRQNLKINFLIGGHFENGGHLGRKSKKAAALDCFSYQLDIICKKPRWNWLNCRRRRRTHTHARTHTHTHTHAHKMKKCLQKNTKWTLTASERLCGNNIRLIREAI